MAFRWYRKRARRRSFRRSFRRRSFRRGFRARRGRVRLRRVGYRL